MSATSIALDNARKRQRRQAAGNLVVGAFFGRPGGGAAGAAGGAGAAPMAAPSNTNAAATAPGGPSSGKTIKKKQSTAQPRPSIAIPPKGIGPVLDPNENDVLSGRGGRINAHVGNVQFREIVAERKKDYLAKETKKLEKAHIAAEVVRQIRSMTPSGRFLKEDADGSWWDIGDAKAIKKVGQALREDAPDIRDPELDGFDDDDFQDGNNANAAATKTTSSTANAAAANPVTSSDVTPIQANRIIAPTSPVGSMPHPPLTTSGPSSGNSGSGSGNNNTKSATAVSSRGGAASAVSNKSATAVSSRGGKLAHASSNNTICSNNSVRVGGGVGMGGVGVTGVLGHHHQTPPQHQPVFQIDLPSQDGYPTAQHRLGTQQGVGGSTTPFLGNLGFRTKGNRVGAAVSGAAAAVMQQQPMHEFEVPAARGGMAEEAFGRTFHSPPDQAESSMISGVSITPSGMSGISALTDPISAVAQSDLGPMSSSSRVARQAMELDRLRPNWNPAGVVAAQESNPAQSVHMLNSHNVNPMNHNALNNAGMRGSDHQRKAMDDMSWAGHSLHGGGLSVREDSVVYGGGGGGTGGSVFSGYSAANDSFGAIMATMKDDAFLNAAVERATEQPSYEQQINYGDNVELAGSNQAYARPMQQQHQQLPPQMQQQNQMQPPPPQFQHQQMQQQQMPPYQQQQQQQQQQAYRGMASSRNQFNDGASVASISMASGMSLPSVGELSENLSALDLASYHGSILD